MDSQVHKSLQREFLQSALLSVLALFLVPLLTYGFVRYRAIRRLFLMTCAPPTCRTRSTATRPCLSACVG